MYHLETIPSCPVPFILQEWYIHQEGLKAFINNNIWEAFDFHWGLVHAISKGDSEPVVSLSLQSFAPICG